MSAANKVRLSLHPALSAPNKVRLSLNPALSAPNKVRLSLNPALSAEDKVRSGLKRTPFRPATRLTWPLAAGDPVDGGPPSLQGRGEINGALAGIGYPRPQS